MENIVHKLEKIREAKRVDKSALAKKIGVSRETVYNWTDENIKLSTFFKVCKVLDTDPAYFLTHEQVNTLNEPKNAYLPSASQKEQLQSKLDFLQEQNAAHILSIKALTTALAALTKQKEKVKTKA